MPLQRSRLPGRLEQEEFRVQETAAVLGGLWHLLAFALAEMLLADLERSENVLARVPFD